MYALWKQRIVERKFVQPSCDSLKYVPYLTREGFFIIIIISQVV